MNTYQDLMQMRHGIYRGNEANGFWKDGFNRNYAEALMLVVSEFSEALEADRHNRRVSNSGVDGEQAYYLSCGQLDDSWSTNFKDHIKDTVEDELADATIRLLDIIQGYGIQVIDNPYFGITEATMLKPLWTGNFAENMFTLCKQVHNAYNHPVLLNFVVANLADYCFAHKIDLLNHVVWKVRYNLTRGKMHGGKLY